MAKFRIRLTGVTHASLYRLSRTVDVEATSPGAAIATGWYLAQKYIVETDSGNRIITVKIVDPERFPLQDWKAR